MLHYTTYQQSSSSNWLLCIHGIGGSSQSWNKQIPFLKEHFNLLVIDLPGHGRSKNINFASWYSLQVLCEYIHDVVNHLQLNKIHVLGMSIGAILALKFSELYPNKTKSLVLSGALLRLSFPLKIFFYGGILISSITGYFTYYKLIAHFLLPEENQLKLSDKMAREAINKQKTEIKKWIKLYKSINRETKSLYHNKNKTPTLIIQGQSDRFLNKVAKEYVRHNPSAQLVIIPDCGHVVTIEKPKEFNENSFRFLNLYS